MSENINEPEITEKESFTENVSRKTSENEPVENETVEVKESPVISDIVTNEPLLASNEPLLVSNEPLSAFSDETYACDRDYAIVLAQLMSHKDREKAFKWIERLNTMNNPDEMREERDMYLKYLILSLTNGKLVTPFSKAPPPGLRPLSSVVPRSVHNHIFKGKYNTGGGYPSSEENDLNTRYSLPDEIEPRLFFSRQPVPRNGGIVYAAAFSTK